MHKRFFLLALLGITLFSCSSSKQAATSSSKLFTLEDLLSYHNTCTNRTCLEQKIKPLGFSYKETVTKSTTKTWIYLRKFDIGKTTYTQTAVFMEKGGYPYIGFSTPASLDAGYYDDMKAAAKKLGFKVEKNGETYLVKKGDTFIDMKTAYNDNGVKTYSFFVY